MIEYSAREREGKRGVSHPEGVLDLLPLLRLAQSAPPAAAPVAPVATADGWLTRPDGRLLVDYHPGSWLLHSQFHSDSRRERTSERHIFQIQQDEQEEQRSIVGQGHRGACQRKPKGNSVNNFILI